MPFLALPAGRLYYEVAGSGPALVFAHGLGGNHLSWWQQVPYFSERYTCVTFAHRGFAPSTGEPDKDRFAEDLADLVDHLRLEDVALVAQSLGGLTCLQYTLRHPERVRALVMSGTTGWIDFGEDLEQVRRETMPLATEFMKKGIHLAAGERMAEEQPALYYLYGGLDRLSVDLDKQAVLASLPSVRPSVGEVAELEVPIFWIFGTEDIIVAPGIPGDRAAALVKKHFPQTRLQMVPESGHSPYFERAALFNQLVDSFLR